MDVFEVTVKFNNGTQDFLKISASDRSAAIGKVWTMYKSRAGAIYKVSAIKFKDREDLTTKRECLKCETIFTSQGFGNRICEPCKSTEVFKMEAFTNSMSPWNTGRMITKKKGSL